MKLRKAILFGRILRRNCLLKHVIEGKIEGTIRRGRKRKQLLDDLKGKRKEEALDRSLWRTRFGRGYGLVRETT
jgi:hypothetical protein